MISVIIPAYNAEKYIVRCLDSVCNQSYRDIQIIAVDDGSEDNTYELIKRRALSDERILPLHKENGGVSAARNYALKKADGEYVFFLDADDTIESDALKILHDAMEDNVTDMVSCQYSKCDINGVILESHDFVNGRFRFNSDSERIDFITQQLLVYSVGFEVWDKLYKTKIISDNNLSFSEDCRIGEDLAFNLKYLAHVSEINCIPERCVNYTIHKDSVMMQEKALSQKIRENIFLLKDTCNYYKTIGKKAFIDCFPLICIRVMDNSYIEHTPQEVTDALKDIDDKDFLIEIYLEIKEKKTEILSLYPDEIAKIKFKYHMYILNSMTDYSFTERIYMFFYNKYRKIRHREVLANWKMPY